MTLLLGIIIYKSPSSDLREYMYRGWKFNGTNACTLPGIKIGNNNKIAAGMVVYKPVENDSTVLFRHKERLVVKKE